MLNNVNDKTPSYGTLRLIHLSFECAIVLSACLSSFYVVCYELDVDDVWNVCWCEFVYVHCFAHVQSYSYALYQMLCSYMSYIYYIYQMLFSYPKLQL